MKPALQQRLEDFFQARIQQTRQVSGGCIANANMLQMEDGARYFLKYGQDLQGSFLCEANGLKALAKPGVLRIPNVIFVDQDCLVLEWIESSTRSRDFMQQLGRKLARLHRTTGEHFGWSEDNYIGATSQPNAPEQSGLSWREFYWQYRLLYQLRLAETNGYATPMLCSLVGRLEQRLDSILSDETEPPCLIHGDLWSGNVMVDDTGQPCLIDPAVYYGHREAELGMTYLFGGFGSDFYRAYQEEYPLADNYEERIDLYKLYHVLNHLNLFGQGYYEQAIQILRRYVS